MRLECTNPANIAYDEFLTEVRQGATDRICIPANIHKFTELNQLISSIYPDLNLPGTATPSYLTERSILAARNDDVASINAAIIETFPRDIHTYFAADNMSEHDNANPHTRNCYPTEFLNSLNPSGLPPFCLSLKVGCPVILLRNIAPK